ncbi:hypothetical protein BJ742DRAFT_786155 [Cladochytrium replicatum]|nr:hypothetical protein BJ742DRAFT_786155 [Cladochytrium replicatum]
MASAQANASSAFSRPPRVPLIRRYPFLNFTVPIVLLTSGLGFWVYTYNNGVRSQKRSASLVKSLLFRIRSDPRTAGVLDENRHWTIDTAREVEGTMNNVKGIADLAMYLKADGTDKFARVEFKGRRQSQDLWDVEKFTVEVDGKQITFA